MKKSAMIMALAAAVIAGYTAKSKGAVINVNPSMSTAQINQAIANSNEGDTINAEDGSYGVPYGGIFDFLPNRDYTFGEATISGSGLEHLGLIRIASGGDMNISAAKNLSLQNSIVGIAIQDVPYDNINIGGVKFINIYEYNIVIENIQHASPLEKAAVNVSSCTSDGGDKFVMFYQGVLEVNEKSPYAGVTNCSLRNLTSSGGVIDVPIFYNEEGDGEWTALGNDEISDNTLINCSSLSKPASFWIYHSPEHIAQKDTGEPLITGEIYYDPWGGEHTFDGENCFISDANDFLPDGITPKRDSRLNLGGGRYIGAIEPYHELEGNLDFDEVVNGVDFAIVANRYDGDISVIIPVVNNWLAIEPNDPNGNPK